MPNVKTQGPLVVALLYDGLCTFEFAITSEVFGTERPELGESWYRFAVCPIESGPLRAKGGVTIVAPEDPSLLDQADIIIVPGWKGAGIPVPPDLIEKLQSAHRRGARIVSICSGAFVAAATGLLSGRKATTHWRYAEQLKAAYPDILVDADVLYIAENRVFTSAGSAAGIDLLLHIIREDFGAQAANSVARRLVMPAHRNGGQAQFIERPVPQSTNGRLVPLLDAIRADIAQPWTVARMADASAMSPRTFNRRFLETTGKPPGEWLVEERLEAAKALLVEWDGPLDSIAARVGFGSSDTLRHHFRNRLGLSPNQYRNRFPQGGIR